MVVNGAVIVAAGKGERMGGVDKAFVLLGRLPLFAHSLMAAMRCPDVDAIALVVRNGLEDDARRAIAALGPQGLPEKPVAVATGGDTRQDSVLAGLRALPKTTEFAAIHDAARPFATPELFSLCFASARANGSGVAARRASDTVKEAGGDGIAVRTLDRSRLWLAATPQVFRRDALMAAIDDAEAAGEQNTDDATAIERAGGAVRLVEWNEPNPKITVRGDLEVAEALLLARERRRPNG